MLIIFRFFFIVMMYRFLLISFYIFLLQINLLNAKSLNSYGANLDSLNNYQDQNILDINKKKDDTIKTNNLKADTFLTGNEVVSKPLSKTLSIDTQNNIREINTKAINFPFLSNGAGNKNGETKYDIQSKMESEKDRWVFYVLLFLSILVTYVWYNFKREIRTLFRAFVNIRIARQLHREYELNLPSNAMLLMINFNISLGLYLYLLIDYFNWVVPVEGFPLFVICTGFISIAYFIQYVTLKLVAYIFPFRDTINLYNFFIVLINKILGLVLFPVIILMVYVHEKIISFVVFFSLFIVLICLLYRYLQGLLIGKNYLKFYKFYFFVYLCTLEIVPILILIKIIHIIF